VNDASRNNGKAGGSTGRGRPWWRPLIEGIDKRVTPPANALVRTNLFADYVALVTRLEARLRRQVEAQTAWWLHQINLPTATDVRRMRAQLGAVEARLRDVDERLEDHVLSKGAAEQAPPEPTAADTTR
jgi:hypothetical protein